MDTIRERMKFLCIVFGCPVRGENTAHLNVLLCFCIAKLHALHERTARDTKKGRMKFWRIAFGCPVRGGNTAHPNILLCFCIAKNSVPGIYLPETLLESLGLSIWP